MRATHNRIDTAAAVRAAFAIAAAEHIAGSTAPLPAAELKVIAQEHGEAETRLAAKIRAEVLKQRDDDVAWVMKTVGAKALVGFATRYVKRRSV